MKIFKQLTEYVVTQLEKPHKKGCLLYSDKIFLTCMYEVVTYQIPYRLRRLFATISVYCNLVNPKEL